MQAIEASGGKAIGGACDIVDASAIRALVQRTVEAFGEAHGLVNNAALFAPLKPRRVEEIESERQIVNIALGTVFKGSLMMLPYVSSQGAVIALTCVVARELGGDGICVNAVAPDLTLSETVAGNKAPYPEALIRGNTATRALSRNQIPENLTGVVGFLVSCDSDFMTGQTIIDGGSVMN